MVKLKEIINAGTITLAAKIGPKLLSVGIKVAKVGKVGLAVGTGVTYAYLFTWQFAAIIMILLFIHESGHIWAMKKCGLKTKGIYFIPFLGAAAVTEEMFKSRRDEVYIAIMGPIWGFIVSVATAGVWVKTGDTFFAAAAGWMAMVNLFNLLPVNPLDGGRIMKSIAFSINSKLGLTFLFIGIIISIILTFWAGIILFFILLIVGSIEFYFEYMISDPNNIIKRSIKDIDDIIGNDPPLSIRNAANNIKNILSNKKDDPLARIKKVIAIGTDNDNDYETRMLSSIISVRSKKLDPIPKMGVKGIIISIVVYVVVIGILWALMTYMNNIPEVEIARKIFMS